MKRTPLTSMLTLLAVLASTFVVAGCGGKSGSSSSSESKTSSPATTTTTTHKHKSKPAY
jgi:ABC-type glycerol-3-phosphate transport system substrate-binding protein